MECAYCHREIGTTYNNGHATMQGVHINKEGQIEKCYTLRKFPLSLILGKRNYSGINGIYKTDEMILRSR